jgi:hypothetical protein
MRNQPIADPLRIGGVAVEPFVEFAILNPGAEDEQAASSVAAARPSHEPSRSAAEGRRTKVAA